MSFSSNAVTMLSSSLLVVYFFLAHFTRHRLERQQRLRHLLRLQLRIIQPRKRLHHLPRQLHPHPRRIRDQRPPRLTLTIADLTAAFGFARG